MVPIKKEIFHKKRKSKLDPRGDHFFKVLERINDNAYKIDLPGMYGVSTTFNIINLSLFYTSSDLRMNPFEEGDDDVCMGMDYGRATKKK